MMYARCRMLAAVFLVLAAAACSKNDTPTSPTPSCTVSTGAISASTFTAAGGTGSVTVTAGSSCSWTSTSSATFVTITAGASGTGNGTATFSVAANTGAARTATLTIAGTAFTISQAAGGTTTPTTPGSLSAPVATSPIGGAAVTVARPPLTVSNAAPTGTVGTVTYRFEISDQATFPNDAARTFSIDGVAQGSGSTTGTVARDLGTNVLWYWHARATDGTVTSAYSATETFRTGSSCTASPTTATVGSGGGTVAITVTGDSSCTWTATSNDSFITVSPSSGTGGGTVTATVAASSGAARTGTVTVAGQTISIAQTTGGIAASFSLFDPSTTSAAVTECRVISGSGTTCTLQSNSFPLSTNSLSNYAWTVSWTDGTAIQRTQSGASSSFSFTHTCGGPDSSTDGTRAPLAVTLTVTDNTGASVTVSSGSGSQPPLFMRLFKC